ncbi:MAG: hypothetical protein HY094_00315 [Candidatus Melainabacteria bacterium]|nr:hypothetical protein [Candidatus Melainabacteria bacterium]
MQYNKIINGNPRLNIITIKDLKKDDSPNSNMPSIPPKLQNILSKLQGVTERDDIYDILDIACENNELKALGNIVFKQGPFQIEVSLRGHSDDLAEKLLTVNNLGIKSAPILVDHIKVNDDYGVLVTYHEGCENDLPLPYDEAYPTVTSEAKLKFLQEMEILLNYGLVHKYAVEGTPHWYVNPTTGYITLDSWHSLEEVDPTTIDKNQILNSIKKCF